MTMDKTIRLRARHHFSGWLTTVAIALGSAVLVMFAFATADGTAPTRYASPAATESSMEIGAADPDSERNERPPTVDRISHDSSGKTNLQTGGPRECQPERGIVTDCTFD